MTALLTERAAGLRGFESRLKSRKAVLSFEYDGALGEEDRVALEDALRALCAAALPVTEDFMARDEAEARLPNMYQVPPGDEPVRVVRVGEGEQLADERACIGTHVAHTGEIVNPRLPTLRREKDGRWRVTLVVD